METQVATVRVSVEIALEPGSTLILYTDGLVEQRGVSIDVGLEILRAAATDPGDDPKALCDRLLSAMLEVHEPRDDIALVVLRIADREPAQNGRSLELGLPTGGGESGR